MITQLSRPVGDKPVGAWLPLPDAAFCAGVTTRQLERRVRLGHVRKYRLERGPGDRTAGILYSREDCETLRSGRYPAHVAAPNQAGEVRYVPPRTGQRARLSSARPWLKLREAAEFSGLPVSFLRRAALERKFDVIDVGRGQRPDWRFRRDAF